MEVMYTVGSSMRLLDRRGTLRIRRCIRRERAAGVLGARQTKRQIVYGSAIPVCDIGVGITVCLMNVHLSQAQRPRDIRRAASAAVINRYEKNQACLLICDAMAWARERERE